jgi:hyaluronoglucosaminidase
VVSPDIAAKEAAARAATLRRAPLLWDNVPVADGSMRRVLHLGPYVGRDPELPNHTSGVMLNPMQHPRASAVSLFTAARYLADPAKYDPESAWQDAIATLGAGAAKDFAYFAHAHRFSVLTPDDRDGELQTQLGELRDTIADGHDSSAVLDTLCDGARARAAAGASLRASLTDRRLLAEIEPWIESHGRETRRIEIALNAIRVLCGAGPQSEKTLAFLAMEGRLTRAPESALASYGPRRAVYPQLDSTRDESMAFGADQALFIDHCLADEFVVLAEQIAREQLGVR